MVALISPQHVFSPSPEQSARRARTGARHLRVVPGFADGTVGGQRPEVVLPDFELGRRLSTAVPSLRPMLLRLDDVVDAMRWGGSTALRFALVAMALAVAVLSVRLAQGVPPADAPAQFVPGAGIDTTSSAGSGAASGDVVLSFSSTG